MMEQFFDTMIVASSDEEWLQRPIKIQVTKSHLNNCLFPSCQYSANTYKSSDSDYTYLHTVTVNDVQNF